MTSSCKSAAIQEVKDRIAGLDPQQKEELYHFFNQMRSQYLKMFVIEPKCSNNLELFDDTDNQYFSDVCLVLPFNKTVSLALHRNVLSMTSGFFRSLFHNKADAFGSFDPRARCVDWIFNPDDGEMYSVVLPKLLRFCYGAKLELTPLECPAAIAGVFHLQLVCLDEVVKEIEDYLVETARCNPVLGIEIFHQTMKYDECHSEGKSSIDHQLVKAISINRSINCDRATIFYEFLMKIPPQYLEDVEYGADGQLREFDIRLQYISKHELDVGEKHAIMVRCNPENLNLMELKKLEELNCLNKDELLEFYRKALSYAEEKSNKSNQRIDQLERECVQLRKECEDVKRWAFPPPAPPLPHPWSFPPPAPPAPVPPPPPPPPPPCR